ncbi:E3 SUMO-protein ligase PIAS3-like isoform X2 [Stegostoma tigrinum]|uniref:E3 SUMO-protein ligase PIAS3-like isoform X2 n=1 Tax=Stegostoma tigrinum TaxID=3053191 RepID=UPI0028701ADA|nr:E3 SUMO-protein ligase PIAS3-like isoform X2 [Stegostoma tigrinum]
MADDGELRHMVMSFRVSELQVLLGFSGRNKTGRKHELLTKVLYMLKSGCSPAVHMKIKELYRRRFPRKSHTTMELPLLSVQNAVAHPSASASLALGSNPQLHYSTSAASALVSPLLSPLSMLTPKRELDLQHLSPPVHPDVKMRRLPFYDIYDELTKPTTLVSSNGQRFEEAVVTFALTPQQVQQICSSRDLLLGAKGDHTVQVQLRFCLCETSCPQEDYFPPNLFVKVNGKLCPLPGYLPPTKNGVEPKRPSRPINVTSLIKLSATIPNMITINWSSEYGRNYSVSVYLVKQLTSATLLQRLRAKGIRNPDHSRALIKEKLTADPDSEIATTSLRVSLICPLGKMRLSVPCRAVTCTHLQCFDATLYLQMNEKKATWVCPVCDKKAPYENLIIDGLFMEILNSCTHCDEILFKEDGSWSPMQPKRVKQEPYWSSYSSIEASTIYKEPPSRGKYCSQSSQNAEVIDLTLDSSSDEDEVPVKRHCHVVTPTNLPSVNKQLLNLHQLSPMLQSPATNVVTSDYLPSLSIPEYQFSYQMPPLPSDIQGLDLFSFLQADSQHYGSVISSSSEDQTVMRSSLNHFFQFTSSPHFLEPVVSSTSGIHGSANRSSSIISSTVLRGSQHSHPETTALNSGSTVSAPGPSHGLDIISLD